MFIDEGCHVDIMDGPYAGRRGIVRKIRICDDSQKVFIGVDVVNYSNANFELMLFDPIQLKRRRGMTPRERERFEMLHAACLIEREERKAEQEAEWQ